MAAVVSDVFGVSGWAMLEKIARGEADVDALVNEARGVLRIKAQLREALVGQLEPAHRMLLPQ